MNMWINVKEKLPKSRQEVLASIGPEEYDIEILTYFKKGDVQDFSFSKDIKNPLLKLKDALFNPQNEIIVPEDGFYIYDNVTGEAAWRKHADIITHWMPLPKPPQQREDN